MSAVPGGQMSRGAIIRDALTRVGNTNSDLFQQCRIKLNRFLEELYLAWDWPFIYTSVSITLASNGSTQLPPDFLKAQDDWGLIVTTVNGIPARYRVAEVDRMTFEAYQQPAQFTQATLPRVWHADRSVGALLFYPFPDPAVLATLRYKFLPPDVPVGPGGMDPVTVAYDADVPIFPFGNYLCDTILAFAMGYESDPRRAEQESLNDTFFKTIRGAAFPPHAVFPSDSGLDPNVFGPAWQGEGWTIWPLRQW
jgi:hypothetical protein